MEAWRKAEIRKGIIGNAKQNVVSGKEDLEVVHLFMVQGRENVSEMVEFLTSAKENIDDAISILTGKSD